MSIETAPAFGDALAAVAGVEGWMTDAQARRLWDAARAVGPSGRIVEIGSFRARSTIVLAKAAGDGVEVVAIDPHGGGDRGPQEFEPDVALGDSDYAAFHANLEAAGGTLLIHDSFNAVGVMLAQLRLLFAGPEFRYIGRTGSLAEYRHQPLGRRDRAINAARQAADLPYFIRNCIVKLALVAGLRPLARLLGEHGHWPY